MSNIHKLLIFYITFITHVFDFFKSLSCCSVEEDSSFGQSTALVEACRNRDVPLVDLLLKHGARDDDCKALFVSVQNKDETLIAKLLSIKVRGIYLFYFYWC